MKMHILRVTLVILFFALCVKALVADAATVQRNYMLDQISRLGPQIHKTIEKPSDRCDNMKLLAGAFIDSANQGVDQFTELNLINDIINGDMTSKPLTDETIRLLGYQRHMIYDMFRNSEPGKIDKTWYQSQVYQECLNVVR